MGVTLHQLRRGHAGQWPAGPVLLALAVGWPCRIWLCQACWPFWPCPWPSCQAVMGVALHQLRQGHAGQWPAGAGSGCARRARRAGAARGNRARQSWA
jgi:hypothetical protein